MTTATTIPQALRDLAQWVTWRYECEGKPVSKDTSGATKIPYNARTGHKASSTNANTWASFDVAVKAAKQRGHSGVGYVFSADDPFTGIDLDDCIVDGELAPWAAEIIDTMASYTEISPSGCGVKMWVEGKIPSAVKTPNIEMYSQARYFTVTGVQLDGTPSEIRNVNGALSKLYERVKKETDPLPLPRATIDSSEHTREWARKVLARAIEMVTFAADGLKHDTLLDAARLAAGAAPHVSEWEIENALYAAIDSRAADKRGAQKTIRDGIRMGLSAPLPVPPPPPQPTFDADGFACCPTHARRLSVSKNGNGYKCRERDTTTASGWCDFWWKGDGYIQPQLAVENVLVAGELITQAPAAVAAARYQFYNLSGLRALPPVEYLESGEIPAALTTIICGASGAGKSFLMVDYVMRIARKFPDRMVIYIAPEGGSGYHMRTAAWLDHFGGEEPTNVLFVLQAIPLLDPRAVSDFITSIRPMNPVMVVVDTLARCLIGGDENSAKDIGMFFHHTDMIRQETGAAITIVHHTGKSGGGYRGSSVLYGSVESWIDVTNDDGLITVACGKSKDSKPFPPRYLRMVESVDSVVLVPADQVSQRNAKLSEGQRKILETLALEIFRDAGARRAEIVSATGINDMTIFKVLSHLKKKGYINQSKKGDPYFLSDNGRDAIIAYHRDLKRKRLDDELVSANSDELVGSDELVKTRSLPNAQLATSKVTSNSQNASYSHQLATSNEKASLYRDASSLVTSESEDNRSELFKDEPQASETEFRPIPGYDDPPVVTEPATPTFSTELDWTYLRKMFAIQNIAGIRAHCSMRRVSADDILERLFAEGSEK